MPAGRQQRPSLLGIWELEDNAANPFKLFITLSAALTVFFLATTLGIYFLLPLLGMSLLLGTSLVLVTSPIAAFFINLAACLLAGVILASFTYLSKTLSQSFTTNFNMIAWNLIFRQIIANAYTKGDINSKISWQIFNPIAFFYLLIGGLQLIVNKFFHQLFNKQVNFKGTDAGAESPRGPLTAGLLLIPRVLLFIPLLMILLPLNFIGSALAEINGLFFGKTESLSDLASRTRAVSTADWLTGSKPQEARGIIKNPVHRTVAERSSTPTPRGVTDWPARKGAAPSVTVTRNPAGRAATTFGAAATASSDGGDDDIADIRAPASVSVAGIYARSALPRPTLPGQTEAEVDAADEALNEAYDPDTVDPFALGESSR